MKIRRFVIPAALLLLAVLAVLLLRGAKGFRMKDSVRDAIIKVSEVTASVNGTEFPVTLPHSFSALEPRTPVTITTKITPQKDHQLYIKSVYSPAKIYANDKLLYEFGDLADYPAYMQDPATEIFVVDPQGNGEEITLRMEFLSPTARNSLTVHPPLMGNDKAILADRVRQLGMPFVFSTMQLIAGVLLVLTSLAIMLFERQGILFLWLGIFSFTTGAWAFGECNLTGLLIKNPTLLYLLAFMGLFTFSVPLVFFASAAVRFRNPKPVRGIGLFMAVIASVALLLQLTGRVQLSKSMYVFHFLMPMILSGLTVLTVVEWLRYRDVGARRLVLPIGVLAVSTIVEVFNYQFHLTYLFASLFQMGVLFFTVFAGVSGGLYIRDAVNAKAKQRELAFEVNLMEMQVEEQKKRSSIMAENAQVLRQQQHDLRHQLVAIQALVSDDSHALQAYLSDLMSSIPDTWQQYCENAAVNAIVCHYAAVFAKNEIEFSANLTVPKQNPQIADSSLCVLFGNLLENAFEACMRMNEGTRFIRISSRLQYDLLTITMDNSFHGSVTEVDGKFRSSKRDDFGIGLASVRSVAQNSGGDVDFHGEGQVFFSSVYVRV